MDKNAFFKYQEHRGQAGYGAALLVKELTDSANEKYSLLVAGESVPAIFSSPNSFEFDLLNSPVIGKVAGKVSLEDKEVECLLHRDNVYRFEQLKGRILDFLYMTPDFVGYKFSGTISFRPNDAGAEVLRGTYTITPMSADPTPIMDCRSLIKETICILDAVPETLDVGTGGKTVNIVCSATLADAYCKVKIVDGATGATTTTYTATMGTITGKTLPVTLKAASGTTSGTYAIAYITVGNATDAPWTTSIALGFDSSNTTAA